MTNTTGVQDGVAAESGWRANLEIIAIGLGALMAALAQTLVLPVLPLISRDIGASTTEAQWLLTSTLLVGAAAVPVIGRLADMYGRRLMLVVALGALLVGSVIDALTDDIRIMILGRAITGLSSAAIPLGISLLSAVLPEQRKGSAVALVSAMLGVGGALGLPLAGIVAEHFDYHALYWIGAVGALASIVLVLTVVGNPRGARPGAIDFPGIILLVGGLVCLVLPLSQGSSWGWGSFATIGLLVASVVLLALLVVVEKRSPDPLVDMRALSNPPVAITNVASIFVGFALFASFVGTANYVQAPEATGYGFGSSVLVAGLCLMPSGVLMLVLAPVAARLMKAWGPGRVLFVGGLIIAAGLIVRIILTDSLWQIILGSTIVGAGTGIAYASLPSLINVHTPAADLAAANGINTLARSLGSTLASAVGGSLLAAVTVTVGGAALPSLGGYQILFTICAVAATLAAFAGMVVSSPKLATHDRQDVLEPV
ncbi:MFS transporter [Williamsia maris]|uniref:Major Facilitator Superfamily protein n=1 Tax=Williamsia maris TaxID=72806 RepID=A0ABT1HD61_9NOCA|nr:MFS transporter [Williamsia maris]MCP2175616.1 Major Facilitator Superfamily protein [Williamsia maris]